LNIHSVNINKILIQKNLTTTLFFKWSISIIRQNSNSLIFRSSIFTFDCEALSAKSFGAIFIDDRLQTFQSSRLKVHVEASTLELTELDVVEESVVVAVANLEDSSQRFLALLCQLKHGKENRFILLLQNLMLFQC
jgi:hypothetical protein